MRKPMCMNEVFPGVIRNCVRNLRRPLVHGSIRACPEVHRFHKTKFVLASLAFLGRHSRQKAQVQKAAIRVVTHELKSIFEGNDYGIDHTRHFY